jgi:2,3-dihydroxy-p-cumate/2,3-dihydroxybenzoate 3,4-dioxygenase
MRLRSVELEMPQADAAVKFLTDSWGLLGAGVRGKTAFMRGTGDHAYIISATEAATPGIASVTFSGDKDEVAAVAARARAANVAHQPMREFDEPGRSTGFLLQGMEGQIYRFITENEPVAKLPDDRLRPIQLTHAVFNSTDREACVDLAEKIFGFKISDRTGAMSFVRCNRQHHALAYVKSDASSLNHLAFEMKDLEAVMLGIGRMRDMKVPLVWGPGRHGPGNNVFGYFVPPFGGVIEYTSEINLVGDDYPVGTPADWTWPPGRVDQWGVSVPNHPSGEIAERQYLFRPMA